MPKLLWVSLPLLAAAGLLGWRAVRRRLPSRLAINVASSLLLLAYLATTAGLGIFWVANQQLPAFDWHYLFGYATLTLLAVHLVLNLPVVWRFFARRPPVAAAQPQRRTLLAGLAAAAAAAIAYVVGARHGRSELRLVWPAAPVPGQPPTGSGTAALALVERYHAFSSHTRAGVLARAPAVEWGDPPSPFKRDPQAERQALPPAGAARPGGMDAGTIASLLWHAAGVSAVRAGIRLRTSPSSGALFATELYLLGPVLPVPGIWHYDAEHHAIERVAPALPPADPAVLAGAPLVIVATAVFRRTGHKYRDRAYRYILADLGHALENLCAAAQALALAAEPLARFDEAQIAAAIGVDEREEGVLAVVHLRQGPQRTMPPAPGWDRAPAAATDALGITGALHRAGSLRARAARPAADAVLLPPARFQAEDTLARIAARRSQRRFGPGPPGLAAIAALLARAAAPTAMPLSEAVRIDLVVHEAEGLAPGSYRYDPATHVLRPRPNPPPARVASRAAALDQDVAGDAALLVVLSIERAAFAADPAGPARGYRHAFIEAGRIGERVYLEAPRHGLAVCAVGAFYDDEAAALVGIDPANEWVVHLVAVGAAAS